MGSAARIRAGRWSSLMPLSWCRISQGAILQDAQGGIIFLLYLKKTLHLLFLLVRLLGDRSVLMRFTSAPIHTSTTKRDDRTRTGLSMRALVSLFPRMVT